MALIDLDVTRAIEALMPVPAPRPALAPDLTMARQYLALLDPAAQAFTFQTFSEKDIKPDPLAEVLHDGLDKKAADLAAKQRLGGGVYATVNETDGKGRKGPNIVRVRAVWQEDDDGFEGELPLEPSLVVQSSEGKQHRYWLVSDDWPADAKGRADFAGVMARMVRDYGSDPAAKDISRVLRVAGFWHQKGAPQLVRIVAVGERYTRAQILEAFPPLAATKKAPPATAAPRGHSDEAGRLRGALRYIPADDYATWISVGLALKDELGDAGFALWRDWSMSSVKFDEDACRPKWASLAPQGHGAGNLINLARENGWVDHRDAALEAQGSRLAKGLLAEQEAPLSVVRDERRQGKVPFDWRKDLVSAPALAARAFPPIVWLVPGTMVEGLSLLVGRPKLGKSWFILDLCIAIASERGCFMVSVEPGTRGDVLYLALEDNLRRLQRRLKKLCPTGVTPERLEFHTEWPRSDQGGIEALREWTAEHPNAKMVVIDTLAAIRPLGGNDGYGKDYAAIAAIQKLSMETGVSIVVLHHDRKAEADDAFDTVSGTLGITGAADTILILRRDPVSHMCVLHGRGRDVEEFEKAVRFDKDVCVWRLMGDPEDLRRSKERKTVISAIEDTDEPAGPKEIADRTGMKLANLKVLLGKMVKDGVLERSGGKYSVRTPPDER